MNKINLIKLNFALINLCMSINVKLSRTINLKSTNFQTSSVINFRSIINYILEKSNTINSIIFAIKPNIHYNFNYLINNIVLI